MRNRIDDLLDRCGDVDGPFSDEMRAKFWAYFRNPTPETWHEIQACTFLFWRTGLSPKGVWTEVVRRHPKYAELLVRGKGAAAWRGVPDVFVVYRVMNEVTLHALGADATVDKKR